MRVSHGVSFFVLLSALSCGSSDGEGLTADGGIGGSGGSSGSAGSASGGAAGSASGGSGGSAGSAGAAGSPATGGVGGVANPTEPGPLDVAAYDGSATVTATGHTVPVRCHHPVSGGPYPLVLVAHGFQLPASQYDKTAEYLARFGHVACTVDYPAGFTPDHVSSAKDLSGAADFVLAASAAAGNPLSGLVDPEKLGLMGHSLGGKLSVLAASMDSRVDAVLGLDPVDSAMLCNPTQCPDASDTLPLPIPTAFLGETLDSTAGVGGQACAPKADNFETFYAAASSPSIQVTLQGANHMSFLDDPTSCGITCSFCKPATMAHEKAIAITRAYSVSFFERYLKNRAEYDTYLTGDEAQKTWVASSQIQLVSK